LHISPYSDISPYRFKALSVSLLIELKNHHMEIKSVEFANNRIDFVSGSLDGKIKVWIHNKIENNNNWQPIEIEASATKQFFILIIF
jgi:hypothetical protein